MTPFFIQKKKQIIKLKTVNFLNLPRVIFSSESGGSQKSNTDSTLNT